MHAELKFDYVGNVSYTHHSADSSTNGVCLVLTSHATCRWIHL